MLTIKCKSESDLVQLITAIGVDARELRFWDNYHSINKGQYGKNQRDVYLYKVDAALKKVGLTNAQRLTTISTIINSKQL